MTLAYVYGLVTSLLNGFLVSAWDILPKSPIEIYATKASRPRALNHVVTLRFDISLNYRIRRTVLPTKN